jgi:putative CocE/NonD family hydrolase
MTLASEILARRMGLPRPQTRDVVCEPDLRASMDDGAVLLADRWVARAARERRQPTVLVRSPYGRKQAVGLIFGRLLAERGLQVLVQSVRGTFGSEGTFSPFDERADGVATLGWIGEQRWHAGPIGMIGPSYLGLVQWAVAADAGAGLTGLAIQFSASQFHAQTYAGGSLSLETAASWLVIVGEEERRGAPIAIARTLRRLPTLLSELPLADLDEFATGGRVDWYRDAMAHPRRDDAYWVARDYAAGVSKVTAPVQLIGGWYDIFLPWMLEDFCVLQAAGRNVQLMIGPWTHTAPGGTAAGIREGLGWLRAQLLGDSRLVRAAAVRVLVTGERSGGGWRELPGWPPPGTSEYPLWLGDHARLEEQPPQAATAAGDHYRYDPSDPTPSLGGPVLLARAPVVDNRPLEARSDVLTYTASPLQSTLEAIGDSAALAHSGAREIAVNRVRAGCPIDPPNGGSSKIRLIRGRAADTMPAHMRRRLCVAGAVGVGALLGALMPGMAVAAPLAPTNESLVASGSITYTWQGDSALGCAAVGVCGVKGAVIVRPQGQTSLNSFGGMIDISLAASGPTVRALNGSGECVDVLGAPFEPTDLFIRRDAHHRLVGHVEPPVSSGRCAGPVAHDLEGLTVPVRKTGGKLPSFDLRSSRAFVAGPFSGTLTSTLVFTPGLPSGESVTSGGSGGFFPGPAAPHQTLVEQVTLRYRVASLPGTLGVAFSGAPDPFCAALDSCGATGTLQLGLPGYRKTLVISASRVVKQRVSARQAIADLRRGRLAIEGGAPLRSPGSLTVAVQESFVGQDGSRCQDSSTSSQAALGFGGIPGGGGPGLPVVLTEQPGAGLLRTHCPGPADVDVIGASPLLARGSLGVAQLFNRRTVVALTNPGGFSGLGYTGSRGGAIDLLLTLERVSAGTREEKR